MLIQLLKEKMEMKYVSPIYEVEAIETEDIMTASEMANELNISLSGNKTTIDTGLTITPTDEEGNELESTKDAKGVSIGVNFDSLF